MNHLYIAYKTTALLFSQVKKQNNRFTPYKLYVIYFINLIFFTYSFNDFKKITYLIKVNLSI